MEMVKQVQRWGNSSGILLPREWLGKQVQVILIDRTLDIKKEIFDILNPYLKDIIGIYLVGSYARGQEEEDSDIDIVVISNNTKKEIQSGKYSISILTLDSIKRALKKNPINILPRLIEAKTILNETLIIELKNIKPDLKSYREYLKDTKSIVKINKELLDYDRKGNNCLESYELIYSLILRLRGLFLIEQILNKRPYSKNAFIDFLSKEISYNKALVIYNIYKNIRDDKKVVYKDKINIQVIDNLICLLENKIKTIESFRNDKKKKEIRKRD